MTRFNMSRFNANWVLAALLLSATGAAFAEEGGSGRYLPGTTSSFIDAVPASETFIVRSTLINYQGRFTSGLAVPIAGQAALGVDAKVNGAGLTLVWRPEWGGFGDGRWSYAMMGTLPWLDVDVSAQVETQVGGNTIAVSRRDQKSGLGDVMLTPVALNYNCNPDFNINYRINLYTPTGSYEVGRLANTGKNYWSLEPIVGFMYFGQQTGNELSVFLGATFNDENEDTDYKSGNQAHLDFTFAKHFKTPGGMFGAGVTGYWYEQMTGDSGEGANFGDFMSRTRALGITTSYIGKLGGRDLMAELKWMDEFGVDRRPQGQLWVLKALVKF